MPIDPDAIERFLSYRPAPPPDVKGFGEQALYSLIKDVTGAEFTPKTKPKPQQLEAVAFSLILRRALIFMWMRMGKTKTALDWASHLRKAGIWKGRGLVITPSPIVLGVWPGEAQKHSDLTTVTARLSFDDLLNALDSDSDLVLVTWSGLQQMLTTKLRTKRGNKLVVDKEAAHELSRFYDLAIIDEIHLAKNPDSLRFELAASIVKPSLFRFGLTGTPFGKNPFDLWSQFFLIDDGKTFGYNYFFFQQAFGKKKPNVFTPSGYEWVFDKTKLPMINERINSLSLSYKLTSTEAPPPRIIQLDMSGKQLTEYNRIVDEMQGAHARDDQQRKNRYVELRMVSSGYLPFWDDDGTRKHVHLKNHAKADWLANLIDEVNADMQIILFYEYVETGRWVTEMLRKRKLKYGWVYAAKNKYDVVTAFQERKIQWFIAQNVSANMGIDLSVADYQAFVESPTSPTVRLQAESRGLAEHRTKPIILEDIVASPTEMRIFRDVKAGKDFMNSVVYPKDLRA